MIDPHNPHKPRESELRMQWKIKAFLRALWSLRKGIVDGRTQGLRWRACHLNGLGQSCPDLVIGRDGYEHCGGCGCPQWLGSRLVLKYQLPGASCPRNKWPEVRNAYE